MTYPSSDNPIICTCFDIHQNAVEAAITQGHDDFRKLREVLGVAGDCGNCHRPINKLLKAHRMMNAPTKETPLRRRFPMPWQHMSAAKLEQEYSPSSCVDDIMVYLNDYTNYSKEAQNNLSYQSNLAYSDTMGEVLDYFPAATGGPLVVYIHGGYWQKLSKDDSCVMAPGALEQGINLAVIDYTLAPEATVNHMIAQCCRAIAWLIAQSQKLGFDCSKVIIAGSSAGGHLCASVLQAAQQSLHGLSPQAISGAVLLSGVYDLRPLVNTYINEPLNLTNQSATELSPGLYSNQGLPPCILAYGSNETQEFKRQSEEYHQQLLSDGVKSQCFEVAGRNHFDIVFDLAIASASVNQHLHHLITQLNTQD
ncbi:alpha/beta hydrolase fold domain-containing protein [Candidatus Njordibacter sp. Uisw_056]|uniref:alpha/beta hydrolase fold domain-containing protein n=1 Tax=Candidatus Njordibacter sp. Uisw_056 TaxID=3230973 RepID=UPI003D5653A1